jgi:hypothetical protein
MRLFDFIKASGEKLGLGGDEAPKMEDLKKRVAHLGLASQGLNIELEGDTVKVSGTAPSQEDKEKIVLTLGSVTGVARVEVNIETPKTGGEAKFYTVQKGDTLSAIAKSQYGDACKYMSSWRSMDWPWEGENAIFEANKPMLKKGAHRVTVSFVKGFVDGLGSATVAVESTKRPRRTYNGRGLKGDWVAVGDSIRRANSAG